MAGELRAASRTAEINAAMRAAEDHHEPGRRLFHDPFARCFVQRQAYRALGALPSTARAALRVFDRVYGGLHAEIMLRNCYYEAELLRAHETGLRQLVLLGAGYDSLAFRRLLEGLTIFEVDAPATQRLKRTVLARHARLRARSRVVYIECDFERDHLPEVLCGNGFDPSRPCLVVWLGVSYYLSDAAVRRTLIDIDSLTVPESALIWDYMDYRVIDGSTPCPGARRAAASVAKRGEPYVFGLGREEVADVCAQAGFEIEEHLRTPELARSMGPALGVWCSADDYMGVVRARRAGASSCA
jgi:methyltransferase (TIGR00027 family)